MWTSRGELDPARDNKALAVEILQLRAEQAALHGYGSYADYATADTMAGSPEAVMELLEVFLKMDVFTCLLLLTLMFDTPDIGILTEQIAQPS